MIKILQFSIQVIERAISFKTRKKEENVKKLESQLHDLFQCFFSQSFTEISNNLVDI